MRYLTIFFCAVVIILIVSPIIGTEKSPSNDGYCWTQYDYLGEISSTWFKIGYLNGRYEGYDRLSNELYAIATLLSPGENPCARALMTIVDSWVDYYSLGGITWGQMIDGLDEFYSDWRNRQIEISDALYAVKLELTGASATDVDRAKRLLRLPKEKVWEMLVSDTVSQADKRILLRNALKGK
jgi:hypothetical protein